MGIGYAYKCQKCGYEYDIMLGIGRLFSTEYQKCVKAIKRGKYGAEWKNIFLGTPNVAIDAEEYLYICNSCGDWKVDKSLSLYSSEEVPLLKTYFMPCELKKDYHFIKNYIHKCRRCGKRMRRMDEHHIPATLPCPKCKTENEEYGEIMWD